MKAGFWRETRRKFSEKLRPFVEEFLLLFDPNTWRGTSPSSLYLRALARGLKLATLQLCAMTALGILVYRIAGKPAATVVIIVGFTIITALLLRHQKKAVEDYTLWGQIRKQLDVEYERRLEEIARNRRATLEFWKAHEEEIQSFIEHGGTPVDLSPLPPEVKEMVSKEMSDLHRVYHEVSDRMSRGIYL